MSALIEAKVTNRYRPVLGFKLALMELLDNHNLTVTYPHLYTVPVVSGSILPLGQEEQTGLH